MSTLASDVERVAVAGDNGEPLRASQNAHFVAALVLVQVALCDADRVLQCDAREADLGSRAVRTHDDGHAIDGGHEAAYELGHEVAVLAHVTSSPNGWRGSSARRRAAWRSQ